MPQPDAYQETIANDGFAVVSSVLTADEVRLLRAAIRSGVRQAADDTAVRDRGSVYAIRNLADVVPEVRSLERQSSVRELVEPILGDHAFLVRATLFTKSVRANWGVFWHQDLSIAVRQRADVPGYGPWTCKAGVTCVQPPVEILQSMLAVRLHLDHCDGGNGPLKVIPGSHRQARLSERQTELWKSSGKPVMCTVPSGGALVMRPLLLHSSSKTTTPGQRRVLHLEFAAVDLPVPLEWHERERCPAAG